MISKIGEDIWISPLIKPDNKHIYTYVTVFDEDFQSELGKIYVRRKSAGKFTIHLYRQDLNELKFVLEFENERLLKKHISCIADKMRFC